MYVCTQSVQCGEDKFSRNCGIAFAGASGIAALFTYFGVRNDRQNNLKKLDDIYLDNAKEMNSLKAQQKAFLVERLDVVNQLLQLNEKDENLLEKNELLMKKQDLDNKITINKSLIANINSNLNMYEKKIRKGKFFGGKENYEINMDDKDIFKESLLEHDRNEIKGILDDRFKNAQEMDSGRYRADVKALIASWEIVRKNEAKYNKLNEALENKQKIEEIINNQNKQKKLQTMKDKDIMFSIDKKDNVNIKEIIEELTQKQKQAEEALIFSENEYFKKRDNFKNEFLKEHNGGEIVIGFDAKKNLQFDIKDGASVKKEQDVVNKNIENNKALYGQKKGIDKINDKEKEGYDKQYALKTKYQHEISAQERSLDQGFREKNPFPGPLSSDKEREAYKQREIEYELRKEKELNNLANLLEEKNKKLMKNQQLKESYEEGVSDKDIKLQTALIRENKNKHAEANNWWNRLLKRTNNPEFKRSDYYSRDLLQKEREKDREIFTQQNKMSDYIF